MGNIEVLPSSPISFGVERNVHLYQAERHKIPPIQIFILSMFNSLTCAKSGVTRAATILSINPLRINAPYAFRANPNSEIPWC
jgi:hypothetical protein